MSEEERLSSAERLARLLEEHEASDERREEKLDDRIGKLNDELKLEERLTKLGKGRVDFDKQQISFQKQRLELEKKELKLKREAAELGRDLNDAELKQLANMRAALASQEGGAAATENMLQSVLGITEQFGLFESLLTDPMNTMAGAFGKIASLKPAKIFGSIVRNSIELAVAQDMAAVNFRKATSAGLEYDQTIRGLERDFYFAGISADEAGQTIGSLFENVTDFSAMQPETRKALADTVVLLNELGVAAETSSKNIQFSMKVLGQTPKEAAKTQRSLRTFAKELGVSAQKIADDFESFGPQIAALGSRGVAAFKSLEVQAKNTGLAMSEILGVVEKFDKFDSAGEAVGRLNALLGGPYLNTLELIQETDPSKRFELLKNSIDEAGLSFDTMDYYQRKALASAMGLNETQLALMMRGKLDLIKEPMKSAEDIEKLAEQTAQFNDVMTELSQIGKGLIIAFGPLISTFKAAIQLLDEWMPLMQPLIVGLGIWATGANIAAVSTMGLSGALMVMKVALTVGAIGAVIAITYAVYKLAEWLSPGSGPLIVGLAAASAALIYFGVTVGIASAGILPLIGVIITLGTMLFNHMFSPSLIEILGLAAAAFFLLPPAILAFGVALFSLLPLLPFLGILTLGIIRVANAMAPLAESLVEMAAASVVNNLIAVAAAVREIGTAINEIDEDKAITLTTTMATAAVAAPALAVGAAAMTAITAPLRAESAGGDPGGGAAPPIHVHLSIDGTEFATAVNKVEVEKYTAGRPSSMYNTIVDMIAQGFSEGT